MTLLRGMPSELAMHHTCMGRRKTDDYSKTLHCYVSHHGDEVPVSRKRFVKPVIGQPLGVPPRAFVVGVLGKTGGRVGTTDVGKMTTAS